MSNETGSGAEMPKYQCHKEVWALKIKSVRYFGGGTGAELTPEDGRFSPIFVPREFTDKHDPASGGYYVVYADGYKSFSPAKAFEEGYTKI